MEHKVVNAVVKKIETRAKKRLQDKCFNDDIECISDVPYVNDFERGHLFDVYYKRNKQDLLPVLIDIHGGGFVCSHKELNKWFGYNLALKDYLVFNVNYRLVNDKIIFPNQVEDITNATNYIFEHLSDYGGDKSKVYLIGHSAGAVLALLEVMRHNRYKGLVLDCGLMDCIKETIIFKGMKRMIFTPDYINQSYYQQLDWSNNDKLKLIPKTYLISNKKDELRNMTINFKKLLDELNIDNKLNYNTDESLGHMEIIYNPENRVNQKIINDMLDYLK